MKRANPELTEAFLHFRRTYFPRRLNGWRVVDLPLGIGGYADFPAKEIAVDVKAHRKRNVPARYTLLHEMCHAAAGPNDNMDSDGHGSPFLREVDRLLAAGAPWRISFGEVVWANRLVVERLRFRHVRAALLPLYVKPPSPWMTPNRDARQLALKRWFRQHPSVTLGKIVEDFGVQIGIVDLDGRKIRSEAWLYEKARRLWSDD